jgi:hypothetical protein
VSRHQPFLNIRTEGALLPSDLLSRLMEGANLPGLKPEDYHLGVGEKLNEAISRSWTRLLSLWSAFRKAQAALPLTDLGTTLTRERWLLQLFQELGYGRLIVASPFEIDGKTYPISHIWQGQYYQVPIHLVSFRADLDKRSEQRIQGASKASPHGMVQEYLNRSENHLWALASNGLKLLNLRDNASLTRQAYVEFDLEGIFDGEAYSDFRLLWMLCHQSRLEGTAQNRPETCWLEVWSKQAETEGRRALDQLRVGVQKALENLGTGFISHKGNQNLCQRLKAGELNKQDLYRQLLRLVYRLIFLFVAEDRDLLHSPNASDKARSRYAHFYSGQRLRRMAERTRGSRHADLWVGLRLVFSRLGDDRGCPELGLPALGGLLFGPEAMPDLESAELSNEHLLQAVRNLGLVKDRSGWRLVDYRNLGSEELGSVYESLLELNPTMELDAGIFTLDTVAGNQRKTSGSYYTPDSLVQCLLDSALDPVVEEAIRGKSPAEAERAILALKVCDPAVGSGHFLVGAAHRLANHLARARARAQGESEPSPLFHQHALRDVIGHCLYGVDLNPMAAELCRVSLWLEAIEPGKPLSFLDHHIRVGNSLLGTTPALLAQGIPDEAFTPIEGDDKEICSRFKKVNKDERKGHRRLFAATTEPWEQLGNLAASMMHLDAAPDDSIDAIRNKERMYEAMVRSGNYLDGQFWADAWCAAFVWKKTREFNYPITEEVFRRIEHNPHACDVWMRAETERLAAQYTFFHWHLAFPDVFHVPPAGDTPENEQAGWSGGFDLVLGNPPWERIKIQEKEWFAERRPDIAKAANAAARKRAIQEIQHEDQALWGAWQDALRASDGEAALVRSTGRFPLCGRGDTNTFSVFAEANSQLINTRGRAGFIVPSGIATDDTTKLYFQEMVESGSIVSLYDFQSGPGLFSEIGHARFKFSLLTLAGRRKDAPVAQFAFFLRSLDELQDAERRFELSVCDICLLNPNTRTCPIFRTRHDAELTKAIYRRVPILIEDADAGIQNPWGLTFLPMFHMSGDSDEFHTAEQMLAGEFTLTGNIFSRGVERYLPLYEAKMVHQFDHRFGDYAFREADYEGTALPQVPLERLQNSDYAIQPRYWIPEKDVRERLDGRWDRSWLIGWRDITNATNERTVISSVIPAYGVGARFPLMFSSQPIGKLCCLVASLNSIALDYCARQKLGGTALTYFIFKQLPVFTPSQYQSFPEWIGSGRVSTWVISRFLELTFCAWDLQPFAQDCGYSGPPFRWDEDRRFLLRCELDAAFFHLYLPADTNGDWLPTEHETVDDLARLKASLPTPRAAVAHIMETFPIVQRKDEETWNGEYRTKRVILEIYDAMAEATRTGIPYQTRLDPPPADASCRHPKKKIGILAFGSLIKDPGAELLPKIGMRITKQTPFPVEYGRFSGKTRGGAPTLVPHESGAPVSAEILVLDDGVSIEEARNMLWRRETRQVDTSRAYIRGDSENSMLVEEIYDDPCVETVLYTNFNPTGKILHPTAADLAKRAIASVSAAPEGMDGITYLMNAIRSGIETPLTADYKAEILKQTVALTLEDALKEVKERQ